MGASVAKGSGRDGRVTKEDVVQAVASMGSKPAHAARSSERKRMSSLRRSLSKRLVSVKNETAMLTTFNEVDMKPIFDLRKQYKEAFKEKHEVGLGFMSFFTKACVRALRMYPGVNSMIDGNDMIEHEYCDISIAVSGPKGSDGPCGTECRRTQFFRRRKRSSDWRSAFVREKSLDEMTGGTFTITNGGVFGSMLSTPIINPPQSAILGMHNIVERAVVVDGEIVIRPMMYVFFIRPPHHRWQRKCRLPGGGQRGP